MIGWPWPLFPLLEDLAVAPLGWILLWHPQVAIFVHSFSTLCFNVADGSESRKHLSQIWPSSRQFPNGTGPNLPRSAAPGPTGDGPGPTTQRADAELPGAAAAERHSKAWRCAAGLAAEAGNREGGNGEGHGEKLVKQVFEMIGKECFFLDVSDENVGA